MKITLSLKLLLAMMKVILIGKINMLPFEVRLAKEHHIIRAGAFITCQIRIPQTQTKQKPFAKTTQVLATYTTQH